MTALQAPAPSAEVAAKATRYGGFGRVLRAEWTKWRTVRGWLIGLIVGVILMIFLGVTVSNAQIGCVMNGVQKTARACLPPVAIGPGGEAVQDSYYFVRQPLAGNGRITARLTGLTSHNQGNSGQSGPHPAGDAGGGTPGALTTVPWSKGGIIITASTKQGAAYAAMLATGSNGVRMQYNYTGDVAGLPGKVSAASPRWLRLVRSGDTITGYDSANGTSWTQVGSVTLANLPRIVQIGLFATSPQVFQVSTSFGAQSVGQSSTTTTAVIDDVTLSGSTPAHAWTGDPISTTASTAPADNGSYRQAGSTFTVTGQGDIAPLEPGPGNGVPTATISQSLVGAFAALIAFVVIGGTFMTSEYRRGLIKTTLTAAPRRGQVLAAKAVVAGLVTFAAGLVGVVASIVYGVAKERQQGQFVLPVSPLAEVQVIVGTAAALALLAVIAVCLGAMLRRSAITITIGILGIVLPFLFAVIGVFPANVSDWLLRVSPAAGLALEQSIPNYRQVTSIVSPVDGYFPLSPGAGFLVLLAWTAAAGALAFYLLRRRDA
jgi:ABC-type transport system involved in multi-copper enzyme maturation permease subunit